MSAVEQHYTYVTRFVLSRFHDDEYVSIAGLAMVEAQSRLEPQFTEKQARQYLLRAALRRCLDYKRREARSLGTLDTESLEARSPETPRFELLDGLDAGDQDFMEAWLAGTLEARQGSAYRRLQKIKGFLRASHV